MYLCVGSALLVQLQWAMREPRSVERVNNQISTLFLYSYKNILNAESGRSIGNNNIILWN